MKKHFYFNKFKHVFAVALCAIATLAVTACGKEGTTESAGTDGEEYVYVPEYNTLENDNENTYFNNLIIQDNFLYYSINTYDAKPEASSMSLCKQSLADGSQENIALSMTENSNLSSFTLDEEGNIYAVFNIYNQENVTEEENAVTNIILKKYDAAGETIFEQIITDAINKEAPNSYVQNIAVDGEGNIYIGTQKVVFLLDENGQSQGNVGLSEGWINGIIMGKDGKVYFYYNDSAIDAGGTVLSQIDFKDRKVGKTYTNLPSINWNGLIPGTVTDFLINDGSKIYEYDMETQTYEEIFAWLDGNINGDYVEYFNVSEEGNIVAVLRDWNTNTLEIAKLEKTISDEPIDKIEIVVGTLYDSPDLQEAAVQFNKKNKQYNVTIKIYVDLTNWSETSYSDGITNLQNDLISDTNCPDVICMTQLDDKKLAARGVFEDLNPYLDQSSVHSREDFIETILDAYSYDGKLFSIPATVNMQTVIGKTSVVGEEPGWTIEEMMAIAKEYPEATLFDGMPRSNMLSMCMQYNQSDFIDWEKGECYFDAEEFRQVLEFCNMFPEESDNSNSLVKKFQSNQVLLESITINDLQELQYYEAMFGEPITYIGFPTSDGSMGCNMFTNTRYGIASKSKNKDGAWAFIESYLSTDYDNNFWWGLPTQKADLDDMIAKATAPKYILDENGDPLLDANGEPINAEIKTTNWDGWEFTYYTPTKKDAKIVRDLLAEASPLATTDDELLTILTEEAEAYFKGQKSIDDVMDIIQNRAQIYVSENS